MSNRYLSPALLPKKDHPSAATKHSYAIGESSRTGLTSRNRTPTRNSSLHGEGYEPSISASHSGEVVLNDILIEKDSKLEARIESKIDNKIENKTVLEPITDKQQLYNLWVHDEKFSKQDLVLNPDFFPHISPGDLLYIYHPDSKTQRPDVHLCRHNSCDRTADGPNRVSSLGQNQKNKCDCGPVQKLVIMASVIDKETVAKQPLLQVSITQQIASIFGLKTRTSVVVSKVDRDSVAAKYVEISFKDQYLGRNDMWRLKMSLGHTCVYVGKKVLFAGCIRVQIKRIALQQRPVACGYITPSTRFIFRSESARCFLYLQLSREMWEFEEDGFLFSEKALNGFLPELTEKWRQKGAHHVVSIILFTRVFYNVEMDGVCQTKDGQYYRDYFKVVVDWETRQDWLQVLRDLKREEMVFFQRDILQRDTSGYAGLEGVVSTAADGNILEALNMALNGFDRHYVDRDLIRTGQCIVVVTPGNGLFRVDKHLLRMTFERMNDNGISLDLVCLSKQPLHQTPLFQFQSTLPPSSVHEAGTKSSKIERMSVGTDGSRSLRIEPPELRTEARLDPRDLLYLDDVSSDRTHDYYAIPHWVEWSYYDGPQVSYNKNSYFIPRCKMPSLQTIGIHGESCSSFAIPYFETGDSTDTLLSRQLARDTYDAAIFHADKRPVKLRSQQRTIRETPEPHSDVRLSPSRDSEVHRRSLDGRLNQNADLMNAYPLSRSAPRTGIDLMPFPKEPSKENTKEFSKESAKFPAKETKIGFDTTVKPITIKFKTQDHRSLHSSPKNSYVKSDSRVLNASPKNSHVETPRSSPISDSQRMLVKPTTKITTKTPPKATTQQIILNPCQPGKNAPRAQPLGRWQHIFTPPTKDATKWLSLCSPACLPLTTECFPSGDELTEFYQEYTYTISPNDEGSEYSGETVSASRSAIGLLKELISQRLAQGFQLVVVETSDSNASKGVTGILPGPEVSLAAAGVDVFSVTKPYYLTMGNHIHRLMYDSSGQNVEVKRYVRQNQYSTDSITYRCMIWPRTGHTYAPHTVTFSYPNPNAYNWNYLDHLISGYQEEMTEGLRFWRARFVLLPNDTLPAAATTLESSLDEEEMRLALFSKFLEQFQKVCIATEQGNMRAKRPDLSINQLNITYTTLTPSAFMRSEARGSKITPTPPRRGFGFISSGDKLTKDSKLSTIAQAMLAQGSGVKISDRRWHLKLFENVMVGNELVDWFIRNFSDITSREDATRLGVNLISRGLLIHCRNIHPFMDGHYFYQLTPDFAPAPHAKPNLGWFRHRPASTSTHVSLDSRNDLEPEFDGGPPVPIVLSKSMAIDLDLARKSNRQEVAFLHYDTIYNSHHCYHFQLHWLGCTSRLVDDLLQSWSRTAEKCGLKLIEAPVAPTPLISNENPFRAPVLISYALPPPDISEVTQNLFVPGLASAVPSDLFSALLLKKFDFVLDMESESRFQAFYAVSRYSFSQPRFERTQYMHRSGSAIVQIRNKQQGLIWENNRLMTSSGHRNNSNNHETLRQELTDFCSDPQQLDIFWNSCCQRLGTREGLESLLDEFIDDALPLIPLQFSNDSKSDGKLDVSVSEISLNTTGIPSPSPLSPVDN